MLKAALFIGRENCLNLQSVQLLLSMAQHWPDLQAQYLMPGYQVIQN